MTVQQPINETLLLQQIGQQDQAALSQLYDRYARVMYSLAYKILGAAEESEEVVLDVFAQVWRTAQNYDETKGRVDGWLFLMTRSRSLDRLRKRQRQTKVVDATTTEAQVQTKTPVCTPEEELLIRERRDRVLTALAQIPNEQRQVLELAYYQGLSQSEIAAKMGTSLGTVKTRVRLGLNKLKGILDGV